MVVGRHGCWGSAVGAGSGRDGAAAAAAGRSCVEAHFPQGEQKEKYDWAAAENMEGPARESHPAQIDLIKQWAHKMITEHSTIDREINGLYGKFSLNRIAGMNI